MGGGGLLRRGKGKSSGRREHCWNFSDVLWVEYILSVPPFGGSKDSCSVERLRLHLIAVVFTHLCQLLYQPGISFLHPTVIRCLLRSLSSFLGRLRCFLGLL